MPFVEHDGRLYYTDGGSPVPVLPGVAATAPKSLRLQWAAAVGTCLGLLTVAGTIGLCVRVFTLAAGL